MDHDAAFAANLDAALVQHLTNGVIGKHLKTTLRSWWSRRRSPYRQIKGIDKLYLTSSVWIHREQQLWWSYDNLAKPLYKDSNEVFARHLLATAKQNLDKPLMGFAFTAEACKYSFRQVPVKSTRKRWFAMLFKWNLSHGIRQRLLETVNST